MKEVIEVVEPTEVMKEVTEVMKEVIEVIEEVTEVIEEEIIIHTIVNHLIQINITKIQMMNYINKEREMKNCNELNNYRLDSNLQNYYEEFSKKPKEKYNLYIIPLQILQKENLTMIFL